MEADGSSDDGQNRKGVLGLELNHTHFLMLDDGTIRRFDTDDYRTRLCAHLGKIEIEHESLSKPICIIFEEQMKSYMYSSSTCGESGLGRWKRYDC